MSAKGIDMLIRRFRQAIDYGRKEFDLSYAELLGTLRVVAREVEDEMTAVAVEDDESDDDEAWKG